MQTHAVSLLVVAFPFIISELTGLSGITYKPRTGSKEKFNQFIFMIDYTETEIDAVERTLRQRYREDIEIHLADCEVQPDQKKDEVVERPAIFWQAQGCNFIIIKMDEKRFEGRYFYNPGKQFGSGQQLYKDVANCALSLLRCQADDVRESQGVVTGTTGADLN